MLKDLLEWEPNNRKSLKEILEAAYFTMKSSSNDNERTFTEQSDNLDDAYLIAESGKLPVLDKGEIRAFSSTMFNNSPFANKKRE